MYTSVYLGIQRSMYFHTGCALSSGGSIFTAATYTRQWRRIEFPDGGGGGQTKVEGRCHPPGGR